MDVLVLELWRLRGNFFFLYLIPFRSVGDDALNNLILVWGSSHISAPAYIWW